MKKSRKLINAIGFVLNGVENPISIEGHTDNIPIKTEEYASNWELSTDRALTILKEMIMEQSHLQPGNFSATGYAEYRPLGNNSTAAGRDINRRVEIVIKRINGANLMVPEGGGN